MKKVLYFSTTWCGPCKMFKPVVQQVSMETGIPVSFIDAEQNQELAKKYSISSVPTIIITDAVGTVLYRNSGVMSKAQLQQMMTTIG